MQRFTLSLLTALAVASRDAWGILGIGIICVGGYILNLAPGRHSVLATLKAVLREKGSWLMLIVSFIYSLGAVFGKQTIAHSSPLFFTILNIVRLAQFRACGKIKLHAFEPRTKID